ncbi:polyprenyl synthetase family protein [Marinimicrobium sp. ABcell2]|uniref:polyprenyl synthetase family protein n=1 Tax=Marinimicrobium sp. ABcell2 TaxID=3069751 RepID=UPI0027B2E277|nr:farnesyl diphosphate synthase [Marinimicrobium sp. ABcell2]MDQ2076343.1 polyprenyl synthetase family protein [Marinimicrobium sp. ABcell2]
MTEQFDAFAAQCRARADAALKARLPAPDSQQPDLAEAMAYSLFNGGKRVRPTLIYAVGEALNAPQAAGLDTVAAAVECVHAYSLAHDDLPAMDDDDLRRGKPSCHIAFNEATAILAGDALQTLAFQLLAENNELSAILKVALVTRLAQASGMQGMVLGQAIDLGAVNKALDITRLERMHHCKTGALISASVAMAALVCEASDSQIQSLERYTRALGLAFQVQDDILDVTSDTATLGKHQGSDLKQNKPTYVSLLGLEGAQQRADELYREALDAIAEFNDSAGWLRALAAYIVQRNH